MCVTIFTDPDIDFQSGVNKPVATTTSAQTTTNMVVLTTEVETTIDMMETDTITCVEETSSNAKERTTGTEETTDPAESTTETAEGSSSSVHQTDDMETSFVPYSSTELSSYSTDMSYDNFMQGTTPEPDGSKFL